MAAKKRTEKLNFEVYLCRISIRQTSLLRTLFFSVTPTVTYVAVHWEFPQYIGSTNCPDSVALRPMYVNLVIQLRPAHFPVNRELERLHKTLAVEALFIFYLLPVSWQFYLSATLCVVPPIVVLFCTTPTLRYTFCSIWNDVVVLNISREAAQVSSPL